MPTPSYSCFLTTQITVKSLQTKSDAVTVLDETRILWLILLIKKYFVREQNFHAIKTTDSEHFVDGAWIQMTSNWE